MQVLVAALFLVSDALELDLASLLQARLDGHLEDRIRGLALAGFVERLALDLHLLRDAVIELLERQREWPLHRRDLGRVLACRAGHRLCAGPAGTGAEWAATHAGRPAAGAACAATEGGEEIVVLHATTTVTAHELLEHTLCGVVVEARCGEVEAAARATRAAEAEALEARHAAGGAKWAFAGTWWRGLATAEEELEAVRVVDLSLFRVREDLVGLRNLLELLSGRRIVLVLVGMPF